MSTVDATAYLNGLLAAQPPIAVQGVEYYEKTVCKKGPGKWEEPYCVTQTHSRPTTVTGLARVTNSRVVEVRSIDVQSAVPTSIPESALLTRKTIKNFADVSVSSSINLTVTGTESWQVTKTNGVSTTAGASLTISAMSTPIGSGSVTVNVSQTISTSTSTTEGNSRSVSRSTNDTVSIGPHKSIQYELLAYQSTADLPFRAVVVIDGDLSANLSGLSLASQLLPEQARTLTIDGYIRISAVSEAILSVIELPQVLENDDPATTSETTTESLTVHGEISDLMRASFAAPKQWKRNGIEALPARPLVSKDLLQALGAGDPGIGPPEGTHYEVLYTEKVYRPTPQCGFNDLGVMNGGVFRIEARQYTTYVSGEAVATWGEKVEIFESCWQL